MQNAPSNLANISSTSLSSRESSVGFDDKREHPRDPAHDLSEIILDGKKFGVACLIHDISQSGAKLEISCGDLPRRFILANYTKKTKTLCRQVWRNNRIMGVSFITPPRNFSIAERI